MSWPSRLCGARIAGSSATKWAHRLLGIVVLVLAGSGSATMRAAVGTLADGDVVGWGNNRVGQTNSPAGIFTAITAGSNHSLGLRSDGTLVGWGNNADGETNTPAGIFTAIAAAGKYSLALRSDGKIIAWGTDPGDSFSIPEETFAAVAAGGNFTLGLHPNGSLVGWGINTSGQITIPAGTYTAIAAGLIHSLALRPNGAVVAWGGNASGQTNAPAGTFAAIAAGGVHSVGLRTDGTIADWGTYLGAGQVNPPTGIFTAIAAGEQHSLAIRADGTLAGWGWDADGQTNVPSGVFTAIAGGGTHSLGLRARTDYDGDLRIFGAGTTARLNRSVKVAGDLIVEAPIQRVNNAVAEVGGRLILRNTANLSEGGVYYVGGMQIDSAYTLPANVAIANSGPLTGSATLSLGSGSHLDIGLAPANAYSGVLTLQPSASVTLDGEGVQAAYVLGVSDGAEFRMGPAQRMRTTNTNVGFGLLNSGRIELLGSSSLGPSELEIQGQATNSGGDALITGRDAVLRFAGGLANQDSLVFTGGVNGVSGDVDNTGSIVVSGGAQATFYDDVIQNGALQVSQVASTSSTAVFLGSFTGSRGGAGGGEIFFEGDVHPGNGPGSVTFTNDVLLGGGGSLMMELGGASPGSQYDQLRVTGALSLGGKLQVSLITGFTPSSGQSFNILDWGSLSGTFSSISLPTLAGGTWDVSQLYTTGVLSVASSTINPDFDGNGVVGAGDLVRWKGGFGVNAGAARGQGDANGDGDVDGGDFLAWQRRLGGPPVQAAATQTPEPAAVQLWGTGAICGLLVAGNRRRQERRFVARIGAARANHRPI